MAQSTVYDATTILRGQKVAITGVAACDGVIYVGHADGSMRTYRLSERESGVHLAAPTAAIECRWR